jgi:hypothetical protein
MTTNLRCICAGAGILFVLLAAAAFRPDFWEVVAGRHVAPQVAEN